MSGESEVERGILRRPMFRAPKRRIERVFLHCSAMDEIPGIPLLGLDLYDQISHMHTAPKEKGGNGWRDVGYHFLIDRGGERIFARDLEAMPAAQKGNNTATIAIMVDGLSVFTQASLNECAALCREINMAYSGRISFHGHCEVSIKSCPVFDYHGLLNLDRWQRMP